MAATLWQSINIHAADGGLASCFAAANVAPSVIKHIVEVQQCKTLRDFATSYTAKDHEDQLGLIWMADAETKAVRAHRGRLLSAWRPASTVITKLEETPNKPEGANAMASDLIGKHPWRKTTETESGQIGKANTLFASRRTYARASHWYAVLTANSVCGSFRCATYGSGSRCSMSVPPIRWSRQG